MVRYEGLYEVSDWGRVRRVNSTRRIVQERNGMLLQAVKYDGYYDVQISGWGKRRSLSVHRLVLEAFRGPRPKRIVANHKNGKKTDNRLENLEWVTPSENVRHAMRLGLAHPRFPPHQAAYGSRHGNAKLNEEKVAQILKIEGRQYADIGAEFGVAASTICDIRRGRIWKHVDPSLLKGEIRLNGQVLTVKSNHETTWPEDVDRVPAQEKSDGRKRG